MKRYLRIFPVIALTLIGAVVFAPLMRAQASANPNATINDANSILEASKSGDLERVKVLLSANPELVNAKDSNGDTPLHFAATSGHTDIVDYLLSNKADVNAKDLDWCTPLIWAAGGAGNKDVVIILLANKADVNAQAKPGAGSHTALHEAAIFGFKDVAEVLLANKADVNAEASGGWTPLHFAAKNNRTEMVKLLLAANANTKSVNSNNETPADLAEESGYKDVADLIRQKVTSPVSPQQPPSSSDSRGADMEPTNRGSDAGAAFCSLKSDCTPSQVEKEAQTEAEQFNYTDKEKASYEEAFTKAYSRKANSQ